MESASNNTNVVDDDVSETPPVKCESVEKEI